MKNRDTDLNSTGGAKSWCEQTFWSAATASLWKSTRALTVTGLLTSTFMTFPADQAHAFATSGNTILIQDGASIGTCYVRIRTFDNSEKLSLSLNQGADNRRVILEADRNDPSPFA